MRKSLRQVTIEDLVGTPVWRYETGSGDDDAVVESTELTALTESSNDTFIALTTFTLHDDTVLQGYASPSDTSGLDYIQPVIITGPDHVRLWNGPSADEIARILGRPVDQVFPISWRASVAVDNSVVTGVCERGDVGAA